MMGKTKQSEVKKPETGTATYYFRGEPLLLLSMISNLLSFMNVQGFLREKVCSVNLGYGDEVCSGLKGGERIGMQQEVEIQKLLGILMMTRSILENIFPLFLVILIGAWSDKYGRRFPLLFVTFSFILQNISLLLCYYFKDSVGGWTVAIVSSLIPGLSGNRACFKMATFSYIAENSPPERRTSRLGLANSMTFSGTAIGMGLGGVLARSGIGFVKIFTLNLIFELVIFIYIFLGIHDSKRETSNKPIMEKIMDIFTMQHIYDALSVIQKPRPGNGRKKLYILLFAYFCAFAKIMGEKNVYFLFGKYKFNWDSGEVGFFIAFKNIFGLAFGNFITIGLLSHLLKFSDPALGIWGGISQMLASIFYATVNTSYLMYFGSIVGIFGSANMVVPRSLLSNIIPPRELGKVNSYLGCIDAIAQLVAGPIYALVYTHTFELFPGGFFFVTIILSILPIFGYLYFLKEAKLEGKQK